MAASALASWALIVVLVLAGLALPFAKVNPDPLRRYVHTYPPLALFRFRAYRIVMASVFILLAALVYLDANG